MSDLQAGEYVLATKYADGDPQDHWCVGFYDRPLTQYDVLRHLVVDEDGNQFRGNGFRRVERISAEKGRWLLENAPLIELSGKSIWHFKRLKIKEVQP